jgi:glycosyltransferase involved in cell wall biosynthesis
MNLHIFGGIFHNSSRLLKETESIVSQKLATNVIVTSISIDHRASLEKIDDHRFVHHFPIFFAQFKKSKFIDLLKYCEFCSKIFFKYRGQSIDVLNVHSLNLLFVGILLKYFGKVGRLIYDPHELETERAGLSGISKIISKWIERRFICYVDHIIVVCDPIRDSYRKEYGFEAISVIRNIPKKRPIIFRNNVLRDSLGISYNDIVFIYQGILSEARGIYDIIQAFKNVDHRRHIVFMGFGPAEQDIRAASQLYDNIHFHPAVQPEDILSYTSSCDVGINFISGKICKSYRLSLPNKFFEYLHAGCGVLVSDNLEYLQNIVIDNRLGWSVGPCRDSLAKIISSINLEDLDKRRVDIHSFVEDNFWELDEQQYREAFGHG